MTYRRLLAWLATDQCIHGHTHSLSANLMTLCGLHDNAGTSVTDPLIGLEYHHGREEVVDIAFKGGVEMLQLPHLQNTTDYHHLCDFLHRQSRLDVVDKSNIWVEYDHSPSGYQIAALFQGFRRANAASVDPHQLIDNYLTTLKGNASSRNRSSQCLAMMCELFGIPDFLGVMLRDSDDVVKLVCQIHAQMHSGLTRLLSDHFAEIIASNGLGPDELIGGIDAYASTATAKISLDINLKDDVFLPRLCLEIHPPRHSAIGHRGRIEDSGLIQISTILDHLGISQNLKLSVFGLLQQYPSGKKRLQNFWPGNQEYLYSSYYHAKACMTLGSTSVKSYILHEYLDENAELDSVR